MIYVIESKSREVNPRLWPLGSSRSSRPVLDLFHISGRHDDGITRTGDISEWFERQLRVRVRMGYEILDPFDLAGMGLPQTVADLRRLHERPTRTAQASAVVQAPSGPQNRLPVIDDSGTRTVRVT